MVMMTMMMTMTMTMQVVRQRVEKLQGIPMAANTINQSIIIAHASASGRM
jgi:hypothetical protein